MAPRFMRVEEMARWMSMILPHKSGYNPSVCPLIQALYPVSRACLMASILCGKDGGGDKELTRNTTDTHYLSSASNDNIRLWNTTVESNFTIRSDTEPGFTKPSSSSKVSSTIPFSILAGHHGGTISHISIDPTCKYMITTSGNRGWEGTSTNGCLFYDISAVTAA